MKAKQIFKIAGRVLLLATGKFFVFAILVGVLFGIPEAEKFAREAVWLEKPVLLPENEGKVVILHGTVTMLSPATDPDLGLTFESPVVNRHAEYYRSRYRGAKRWRSLSAVPLVGHAAIGDFEIDPAILELFPANTEIHNLTELTTLPIYTVTDDGKTYASLDDIRGIGDGFFPDMGTYDRDSYTAFDLSVEQTVTVVGIQEGGKLFLCEDLKRTTVHMGVADEKTVLATLIREEWITVAVVFVFALCFFFFGFWGILYFKPKIPEKSAKTHRNKQRKP